MKVISIDLTGPFFFDRDFLERPERPNFFIDVFDPLFGFFGCLRFELQLEVIEFNNKGIVFLRVEIALFDVVQLVDCHNFFFVLRLILLKSGVVQLEERTDLIVGTILAYLLFYQVTLLPDRTVVLAQVERMLVLVELVHRKRQSALP